MSILTLKPQEIPFGAPASSYQFQPSDVKPFLATREAISAYGGILIAECLQRLQRLV